jgi:hypothetical protein
MILDSFGLKIEDCVEHRKLKKTIWSWVLATAGSKK